jgi:hypothetical protein
MNNPELPTGHTIGCGIFNGQKLYTREQMYAMYEKGLKQAEIAVRDVYEMSGSTDAWECVMAVCALLQQEGKK